MKKKPFTLFLGLILVCGSLFAGKGTAYVSHYCATVSVTPYFNLSNITGQDVTVEVVFYRQNNSSGNPVVLLDGDDNPATGTIRVDNAFNYDESPGSGASVKFNIAPYETVVISLNISSGTEIGYGRI
ncbi:MAG: hypothetical protein KAT34_18365, partial [Candidatus Aminicenantes bacterium]|nr:hypothetical protein [Candidatus Aminicenantes bacterium]